MLVEDMSRNKCFFFQARLYRVFYVLYQSVAYLLTLPRITYYSAVFWVVTPYSSDIIQHFLYTASLIEPWSRRVPPKRWLSFNGLHDALSQKTELFITAAARTSDPT
jgi:hypothetical protein